MSKSSNQIISIVLLALILLVGCNVDVDVDVTPDHNKDTKLVPYKPLGKAINAPVEIPYAIDNPLEIIEVKVSEDTNHQRSYFQIHGLIDNAVEESINDAIKSLFDEMLPFVTGEKLPPYRGIESVIDKDKRMYSSNVSVMPQFNHNNILSVAAHVSVMYDPSYGSEYFSTSESLNFDLSSGNTFSIGDVFTNDVDGLEIVNEAIVNYINQRRLSSGVDYYDEYTNFTLVAPFKGIKHNQKFYLSQDGLNVVIDYNNPEFDLKFSDTTVIVPFNSTNGAIAITERFYDSSKPIFTNTATSKRFFRNHHVHLSNITEYESFNKNGMEWNVYTSYPKDLTQGLTMIIEELRAEQDERVTLLSQKSPISYVEQNIYAYAMGTYININVYLHISSTHGGQWEGKNYVYRKTGEPVQLEDLFVQGYDYLTLIKNAVNKTIKEHDLSLSPDHRVFPEDLSFRINETDISFETKLDSNQSLYFNISYEEIGDKNLKVFDN